MSWWLETLIGWAVALPVVTLLCAAVLRGGRLDDEARLEALARRHTSVEGAGGVGSVGTAAGVGIGSESSPGSPAAPLQRVS
jgi:hypothetical protein